MKTQPYWLEVPMLEGAKTGLPDKTGVVVIGSGLAGASAGYFLMKNGFDDVTVIDHQPHDSASYRNAGHILFGTVESMKALREIHGEEKAKKVWSFSIEICNQIETTIKELGIQADYRRDGYLVLSISEVEEQECRDSVALLNQMGFQSDFLPREVTRDLGFKNVFGGRYEAGSAQAHPVKFRNGVMEAFLKLGGKYYSHAKVVSLDENSDGVEVRLEGRTLRAEAAVIAANAYAPLFSDFFATRRLVEPFRGQIIVSKPFAKHRFPVRYPHSFDHGYEYALITEDNRLLIGGWRNHSSTKEVGTYSLEVNPFIEQGLKDFTAKHYQLSEKIEWDYSWSGIMAASKTSLPFIGNTNSPRVYCVAGFTGHGFSWAHGSAKLLADMMAGLPVPDVAAHFNPRLL